MAKVINSFNAGELSPHLYARSDIDKYGSGCLVMENFVPLPYGGADRRPALSYVGDSKQDDAVRLVPFTFSVDDSFLLELGDGYMRFWKDGALIEVDSLPVEVGTPWSDTDLNGLKFWQSADVMWFVDADFHIQRLSRFSNTNWILEPEPFDYPPLLEENQTDITMAPSATTGEIIIESSQDFFDEGHVGSYMKFITIRTAANQGIAASTSVSTPSIGLYVSSSDWEFETNGTWTGKVSIERSLDSGVTWDTYIEIADTRSLPAKNVIFASTSPEPFNSQIRLRYLAATGTLIFSLKALSPYWESMVIFTGYNSATEMVATVIADFQDTPDIITYPEWIPSNLANYDVGNKVRISAALAAGASTNTALADVVGMDYGGGSFWVVTDDGGGVVQLWELDTSFVVESGSPYDLSAELDAVQDIAYFNDQLYVLGTEITPIPNAVVVYSTVGVATGTIYTPAIIGTATGLGYGNGKFYIGSDNVKTYIEELTTSFSLTGRSTNVTGLQKATDIAYVNDFLYVTNPTSTQIDKYSLSNPSAITFINSTISDASPQGIAYDGTSIHVIRTTTNFPVRTYSLVENTIYYENVVADPATGDAIFDEKKWSIRTPAMTTWTEGAFSDYRGHPTAIGLFENRLCYAGTYFDPNTIWLSAIDDYQNFRLGTLDTDAMKLTINSGQIDEIRWLVPQERLVIGTSGSEWSLGASDERRSITPTEFSLKRKTTYGTSHIQAILVNSAVLFLMRQGRKLREWTPSYNLEDHVAIDLSILAEHVTKGGIDQWDYQQQPDNILWNIRSDGQLVGFTYERDQNVTGWHRHVNSEFLFESVAILPKERAEDEVWCSVRVNLGTVETPDYKRFIGKLNTREWGTDYLTEWQGSDLYVTYSSPATATLDGLDHIEGKTIAVVADGAVLDLEYPLTLEVSGTGTDVDDTGTYAAHAFDKPGYGIGNPGEGLLAFDGTQWLMSDISTNEEWTNPSTSLAPPKTGWSVGNLPTPSPAPTLAYNTSDFASIVDGGEIIIDSDAYTTVVVGLPFTSTLAPVWVNAEGKSGSSHGGKLGIRKAVLRFKDTFSAKVGGKLADLEDAKFDSDETPLYTGDAKTWFDNSSEYLKTTYVTQSEPMPCTVQAMYIDLEVK